MSIFHSHVWTIRVQTATVPTAFKGEVSMSEYLAERLALGVTTVLLTCPCGAVRVEEMLGKKVE